MLDAVQRLLHDRPACGMDHAEARRGALAGLVCARPRLRGRYGSEELQELEGGAEFLRAIEQDEDLSLTESDQDYLKMLERWLGMYPEMRPS